MLDHAFKAARKRRTMFSRLVFVVWREKVQCWVCGEKIAQAYQINFRL
jgi:hypothetical protein